MKRGLHFITHSCYAPYELLILSGNLESWNQPADTPDPTGSFIVKTPCRIRIQNYKIKVGGGGETDILCASRSFPGSYDRVSVHRLGRAPTLRYSNHQSQPVHSWLFLEVNLSHTWTVFKPYSLLANLKKLTKTDGYIEIVSYIERCQRKFFYIPIQTRLPTQVIGYLQAS